MSDDTAKWVCEYCTYENFPSAVKCTMCRGPRPFVSEDIYRLHDDRSNSHTVGGGASSCGRRKWTCDKCDHVNPSREVICQQCHGPQVQQQKDEVVVSAHNLPEHMEYLKITPDLAQSLSRPQSSATNESGRRSQSKWICPVCTYENWPRTRKCAMCMTFMSNISFSSRSLQASSGLIAPPSLPAAAERNDHHHQPPLIIATAGGGVHNTASSDKQSHHRGGGGGGLGPLDSSSPTGGENERKARHMRRNADWNWLNACIGVIEGDPSPVEAYLASGGNPARQLTASEVSLLNRSSAFDVGHTLVHLAIRFQREDLLAVLLSQIEGSGSGIKRVPSYVAPDLAADIRRYFAASLRQRKGSFPCNFVNEFPTFALPAEVEELPGAVQEQLFNELLDKDAQCQLESEPAVINWSLELTVRLGSRLYALWNRSSGDCLLDSIMQATWGVFDRDNTLRRALAESLGQSGHVFYPRWKEYEASQASFLQYSLDEAQWQEDWSSLLSLASQPGTSLEQLHVFALAHVLRRPIIVYGVKYVKSFRGEALGYARFEGVYLPLLWEQSFCVRIPIALGYTRGHFSALVPLEPYSRLERPSPGNIGADQLQSTFLPLMDRERKLLPVHFLTQSEMGREETILRQWLDVCETEGGILVAQQLLHKRPLLVAQMVEEWLNHYRRLIQMTSAPFARPVPIQDYLSEGDTDDE